MTAGLFTRSSSASVADLQFYVGRGIDQPDDFVTITVSHRAATVARHDRAALGGAAVGAGHSRELPAPTTRTSRRSSKASALARRLGESRAYDSSARRGDRAGGLSIQDLAQFARQKADTIYHPAGTCRMGPASRSRRGRGQRSSAFTVWSGLRVADASIMPEIVNAPTHAACVMIGEKCASIISDR